jgi:hypothetical protein
LPWAIKLFSEDLNIENASKYLKWKNISFDTQDLREELDLVKIEIREIEDAMIVRSVRRRAWTERSPIFINNIIGDPLIGNDIYCNIQKPCNCKMSNTSDDESENWDAK